MKALGEAGELGRPGLGGGDGGGRAPLGAPREWQVFPGSAGVGLRDCGFPCARVHMHLHARRQSHGCLLSTFYTLLGDEDATANNTAPELRAGFTERCRAAGTPVQSQASLKAQQVKGLPAMQETQKTWGSIPGSGRSPGGRNGNPLQCSCLEGPRTSLVTELQTAERLSTQHPEVSAQLTPGSRQRRGPGDRGRSVSLAGRWTSWETAGACKRWVTPIGCAQGLHLDKHMWCVPSQRASCRALAHLLRPRG